MKSFRTIFEIRRDNRYADAQNGIDGLGGGEIVIRHGVMGNGLVIASDGYNKIVREHEASTRKLISLECVLQ